ncbi:MULTISPECIES: ribosomal protein S18-alanine N-acetyltransferase [Pseudoalteromonas]|uniref:[Ribosomal protein bS18]-alanine N-acetyltransferase n=1 Tax=Pseudoalteromonas obscura TaxID=3048491 RepID=A0ABT7EKU1_9GAMM|nr:MULTISPECIES: ribosomal protein S18-alanine N-acetyltransferase [Pseudoalteromonas]MBQ4837756.1 ribosomal protein S18-alanine N-acetyltransferase [Pseudoalteromonas luteoviolacea]MDK2595666.1 ribosomal protein S18-alanine N-acetyltransferase [Pseudoalteromonas sp. P94(2023)]
MQYLRSEALAKFPIADIMRIENACHSHPWSEKTLTSCIGGRYFNACRDSELGLVGYFIAERAGPDYTLMNICVDPKHQGQGIATELMQALIQQCRDEQAENLFLEVRASNQAAIALYKKVGLNIMGTRKNYYPAELGREDAVLMGLEF